MLRGSCGPLCPTSRRQPAAAITLTGTHPLGSCTSHGHIRLNWRLVHLPVELIDYVVAHELAHLKEMNHSPRFWAVVASIYPDWKQARLTLRTHTKSLPVIEL